MNLYKNYNTKDENNQDIQYILDNRYNNKKNESFDLSKSYERISYKEYVFLNNKYSNKQDLIKKEKIDYDKRFKVYKEDIMAMYNMEMIEGGYGSLYDKNDHFKESLFLWHTRTNKSPKKPFKGPNLSSYEEDYKRLKSYESKRFRTSQC